MFYATLDHLERLILTLVQEAQNLKDELSELVLDFVNLTGKMDVEIKQHRFVAHTYHC